MWEDSGRGHKYNCASHPVDSRDDDLQGTEWLLRVSGTYGCPRLAPELAARTPVCLFVCLFSDLFLEDGQKVNSLSPIFFRNEKCGAGTYLLLWRSR